MASLYSGTKALDAEITIDFSKHSVVMDYSKNDYPSMGGSRSMVISDRFCDVHKMSSIIDVYLEFFFAIAFPIINLIYLIPFQALNGLFGESAHYRHQRFIKFMEIHSRGGGIIERTEFVTGTTHKFWIEHNVWFEYNLSDGAQKEIKRIRFERHFDIFYPHGHNFQEIRQNGWDITFEFNNKPQDLSTITVRHVR